MDKPLENGDRCEVIDSPAGKKSPNFKLQVTIRHRIVGDFGMDHRIYGAMYRCDGPGVQQLTDGGGYQVTGWADFAGAWLRRIDPPALTSESKLSDEAHA